MKFRTIADTISTYLTLLSAVLLPLLLVVWIRSYLVSDRFYRANEGVAIVAGVSNGELSLWAAPTTPDVRHYGHRAREAMWGWSHRRVLQRLAGREHFWLLGFGHARSDALPWRGIPLTGPAVAFVVPLWFLTLLFGIMPMRLLARNMQSSEEFLARRAAEATG